MLRRAVDRLPKVIAGKKAGIRSDIFAERRRAVPGGLGCVAVSRVLTSLPSRRQQAFLILKEGAGILESSIYLTCMMPFVTRQFLKRERGDYLPVIFGVQKLRFHGPASITVREHGIHR
jgi:hypothetical protein